MHTDFGPERIRWIVQGMVILILSIAVHEFGHAWVADRLGDRLPRRQGRVTLNPLAHADPIGTVLLPLVFLTATGGMGFGWGRPVQHTTHDRKKRLLIAAAGPGMNVVLAILIATLHVGLIAAGVLTTRPAMSEVLAYAVGLNFVLFFFNLLPAAPLDGGSVARGLMPDRWLDGWDRFAVYAPFVVMAFLMPTPLGRIFLWPAELLRAQLYNGLGLVFGLR
jgi:Zn-dependent protease